jgi:hypothetical protein
MKLAVLALLGACLPPPYKIDATSARAISDADASTTVGVPPADAAALVIEKLGARGFTVVSTRRADAVLVVKLAGNRDFSGIHTLGSVFYASIEPTPSGSQIKLMGKPTLDHIESCPQVEGEPQCAPLTSDTKWGLSGWEEAQVIRGVIAELALQYEPAPADGLTLRGCGKPVRVGWKR